MNNYYTLFHISNHLSDVFTSRQLRQCYTHQKNHAVLIFSNPSNESEDNEIHVVKHQNNITLFEQTLRSVPGSNRLDFFEELYGMTVTDVSILKGERAICIRFNEEIMLVLKLFGANFNVYLFDEGKVIDAFFKTKYKGSTLDELFPQRNMTPKNNNVRQYLLSKDPKLPRTHLNDVIKQAELSMEDDLDDWLSGLQKELKEHPQPRLTVKEQFTLFSDRYLEDENLRTYENVNEGVRDCFYKEIFTNRFESKRDKYEDQLKSELKKMSHRLSSIQDKEELESKAAEFEKYGHLLMTIPPDQKHPEDHIMADDLYDGGEIRIPLKSSQDLHQNANRFYNKARRTRDAIPFHKKRKNETLEEIDRLEPILSELEQVDSMKALRSFEKKFKEELKDSEKNNNQETQSKFNVREIDGFTIWIGRNAKSNDILTKQADKEDVWLHARGVAGSHVVIRMNRQKSDPPKSIVEKAAALAAFYSKAKGTSLAPVIVTRKKHIRKPKGGKPGAFLIDKEDVVMVKPQNI